MADQRPCLRCVGSGDQFEEPGGQDAPRDPEEEQLQPLGDPQRRRRVGAPVPSPHGGAPGRHAQRQGRDEGEPGTSGRHLPRGPGGARPERVDDHLPRLPGLRRPVRRPLPQPGARGPRHDVRLGDHGVTATLPATATTAETPSPRSRPSILQRSRAVLGPAPVPWGTVGALSVGLAATDGFVLTAVQGATGAIERSQGPFLSWLEVCTLTLPIFFLAVLGALTVARRRVGPALRTARKIVAGALLVVAVGTAVGTAELGVSAAEDYQLQSQLLLVQHANHATAAGGAHVAIDPVQAQKASLATDELGVRYGSGIDLVANVVLVGWVVALRGGRLDVVPRRRRPTDS